MTIEQRKGDVLNVVDGIIVHGCNCKGMFGAGIALQIKRRFPYAYAAYKQIEVEDGLSMGCLSYAEVAPGKFIVNACTQDDFGTDRRQVNYEAVAVCFEKVSELALDIQVERKLAVPPTVYFPQIGAGLAGGNWEIISKIIEESVDKTIPLVLYVYSGKP